MESTTYSSRGGITQRKGNMCSEVMQKGGSVSNYTAELLGIMEVSWPRHCYSFS